MLISVNVFVKTFFCCPFCESNRLLQQNLVQHEAHLWEKELLSQLLSYSPFTFCGCYGNIISISRKKQAALYCKTLHAIEVTFVVSINNRNMPVPVKTDSAYKPIRIKLIDVGNVVIGIVGAFAPFRHHSWFV